MIRPLEPRDLPRLRELQNDYGWEFGKDWMGALCLTDANDVPVMIAGAWRVAEVHMVTDAQWSTPGARAAALETLHRAMEQALEAKGVGQVVTWSDDLKAFGRRLRRLGWIQSARQCWCRRVG